MAVAIYRVFVKQGSTDAVIRPAFDHASKGGNGRMELTNKTNQDIIVRLPGGLFEDGNGQLEPNPETVAVAPGNGNKLVRNVHTNAADGIFNFRVFCTESFSFAEGNSDPEIIIE